MNIEEFRNYCLSFPFSDEKMPFNDKALVFYVKNKMFCLTDIDTFEFINVKCNPEDAIILREQYSEVTPAYHMNKKHWNSINPHGSLSDEQIKQWIKDSYNLVVAGFPKKVKEEIYQYINSEK